MICFERPVGWLDAHKSQKGQTDSVIRAVSSNTGSVLRSGVVVASIKSRSGRKYRIAMDFSNDIVLLDENQITNVIIINKHRAGLIIARRLGHAGTT